MKVLLVAVDGNIMNRFRRICSWSENSYDIICIKSDCHKEPADMFDKVVYLDCDYYDVASYLYNDKKLSLLFEDTIFQHENGCMQISVDYKMMEYYFRYNYSSLKRGLEYLLGLNYKHYDCIVLWGERSWYNLAIKSVNSNVPIIHCERAAYPSMIVMDKTLGQNSSFKDFVNTRNYETDDIFNYCSMISYFEIEPQNITTMGSVLEEIRDKLFADKKDYIVFVPLQVPYDTNMTYPGMKINNNQRLLEYVIEKHGDKAIIIAKKHPGDKFTSYNKLDSFCKKNNIKLVDLDTTYLVEIADIVVTINSQAVIKAFAMGKDTEVLGETYFNVEANKRFVARALFDYYASYYEFDNRLNMFVEGSK